MSTASATPLSVHELRDAVRHGASYDASRLDRILRIDEAQRIIEVQAGTTWGAIARRLRPQDEAAARLANSLPRVGSSVAWNAAGPDGRPTVEHVESLTMVTPDGELRRASRSTNTELFALVVGGQGLFGPLYSVTLRVHTLSRALGEATPCEVLESRASGPTRRLQLLLPPESAGAFLEEARARCADWRIEIARQELRPTRPESDTFLAWARRPYTQVVLSLAVPRGIGGSVRIAQLCRELIDSCLERGGSFSIAQTLDASREQVEACYPILPAFLAEKRRIDPGEKIVNSWYRHHRSLFGRERCDSRWNN